MNILRDLLRTTNRDIGLLILRVGAGSYMVIGHGWGKITGGPEFWADLGGTMELIGIGFGAPFWGFLAAFSEFICSVLLILGLATRPAALLLTGTMSVAAYSHISGVNPGSPETAIIYGLIFLTLVVVGPGRFSIDQQMSDQQSR